MAGHVTELIEEMRKMMIVDSHEHLPSESERIAANVDVFTLFSHYTATDIQAAGMPAEKYESLFDPSIDLEKRWELFRPFLANIRHGSYARAAFIAVKELFGIDDINDNTYRELSARIREHNTPGLYRRILRERCRIRTCLNQGTTTEADGDQFAPLKWINEYTELQSLEHYLTKWNQLVR